MQFVHGLMTVILVGIIFATDHVNPQSDEEESDEDNSSASDEEEESAEEGSSGSESGEVRQTGRSIVPETSTRGDMEKWISGCRNAPQKSFDHYNNGLPGMSCDRQTNKWGKICWGRRNCERNGGKFIGPDHSRCVGFDGNDPLICCLCGGRPA